MCLLNTLSTRKFKYFIFADTDIKLSFFLTINVTQSVHIHCRHTILAHRFFRDLRMEGGDIFPYQSVYWNEIGFWTFMTSRSFSSFLFMSYFLIPPVSFFPSKTIQPLKLSFPLPPPNYWDLREVPTQYSFLYTEALWGVWAISYTSTYGFQSKYILCQGCILNLSIALFN